MDAVGLLRNVGRNTSSQSYKARGSVENTRVMSVDKRCEV